MSKDSISLLKETVNLRILLIAILVAVAGVIVLYFASQDDLWINKTWQILMTNIGALLIVTVAITMLWELFLKRAFLDEILAKAGISKELTHAGIIKITDSFHQEIDWKSFFKNANKLDIFFAYGRTWRNTYKEQIRELANREGARIRIVLPDHDDEQTVKELAKRFDCSTDQLKERIQEAKTYFLKLKSEGRAQLDIWFLPASPTFSFYRFDGIVIIALYTHRREQVPIPTFICEKGGTLYDYIRKEFDSMIENGGTARRVT